MNIPFNKIYDLITEDEIDVRLSDTVITYIAQHLGMRWEDPYEYLQNLELPLDDTTYYDFIGLCIKLDELSEEILDGEVMSDHFWDKRMVSEIVSTDRGIGLHITA